MVISKGIEREKYEDLQVIKEIL